MAAIGSKTVIENEETELRLLLHYFESLKQSTNGKKEKHVVSGVNGAFAITFLSLDFLFTFVVV